MIPYLSKKELLSEVLLAEEAIYLAERGSLALDGTPLRALYGSLLAAERRCFAAYLAYAFLRRSGPASRAVGVMGLGFVCSKSR